jgi:hypothetical protein
MIILAIAIFTAIVFGRIVIQDLAEAWSENKQPRDTDHEQQTNITDTATGNQAPEDEETRTP